ncbi:MAG: MCE family protein [Myxococcales bacterium]|nr:MCE family protein [Myxococcales bacterium]
MAKERAIELKVGLLIIGAIALLAGLVIGLGNFSLAKGQKLHVDFDFIGNLHEGAPVKVAGIKVGRVEKVEFLGGKKDSKGRRTYVRLGVFIEKRAAAAVHSDAEFFINTQGVLGEQYLEIVPGTASKPTITDGAVMRGISPPRADLIVSRLYEFLEGVTRILREDKNAISNLLRAAAGAAGTLDKVLTDNQKKIGALLGNLEKLSAEGIAVLGGVRGAIGDGGSIRRTLGNVQRATGSLARRLDPLLAQAGRALGVVERVGKAIGPDEQRKVRTFIDQLVRIGERIYGIAGDARVIVARLAKGRGTAGALLAKDELYDDLKEMVRDLKRNPWKFLWRQ